MHLCLDYDEFIPFLIKGFNEQQAIIEENQNVIKALQATVEAQQRQINALVRIVEDKIKADIPRKDL